MLLSALVLVGAQAFAAWDSVAVFHRPEKNIVLINERGTTNLRLQNWLALFGEAGCLEFLSTAGDVKISCANVSEGSGCTFRFLPGTETNRFGARGVDSKIAYTDLQGFGFDAAKAEGFDVSFLNSNGDRFRIWADGAFVNFSGSKK